MHPALIYVCAVVTLHTALLMLRHNLRVQCMFARMFARMFVRMPGW